MVGYGHVPPRIWKMTIKLLKVHKKKSQLRTVFNVELLSENIACTHLIHCNIYRNGQDIPERGPYVVWGPDKVGARSLEQGKRPK